MSTLPTPVTVEEAASAAKRLNHRDGMVRIEAILTVRQYLDERMAEALQKAFDAEPAPDGPPMQRDDA